jgi:hypothetical protein
MVPFLINSRFIRNIIQIYHWFKSQSQVKCLFQGPFFSTYLPAHWKSQIIEMLEFLPSISFSSYFFAIFAAN